MKRILLMALFALMMFSCCFDKTQQLEDDLSSMYVIKNDTLASIIKEYDSTYSHLASASDKPYIMVECIKSGNISNLKISYKQDYFRDKNHSPVMMSNLDGIKVLYQETNGLSKYVKLTDEYEQVFNQEKETCQNANSQDFPVWEMHYTDTKLDTVIRNNKF